MTRKSRTSAIVSTVTITLIVVVQSMSQYGRLVTIVRARPNAFVPVHRTPSVRVSTNAERHNHTSPQRTQLLNSKRHIRILGGGLAGLSMAYHLLALQQQQQSQQQFDITIYDTAHEIGTGGASAVAGGYVIYIYIFVHVRFLCFRLSMTIPYICYS